MKPKLTDSTKRTYTHWYNKLLEWSGKQSIRQISQNELDAFFAWMALDMQYPRATVNQAKTAIKHFARANGVELDIKLVSTRATLQRPEFIPHNKAVCIIASLEPPYSDIANLVYNGCNPPGTACAEFASILAGTLAPVGTTVRRETFNKKLKISAKQCNVLTPVSGKVLQQSGILNAIRNGVDRAWLLENAGITAKTLERYLRWC